MPLYDLGISVIHFWIDTGNNAGSTKSRHSKFYPKKLSKLED